MIRPEWLREQGEMLLLSDREIEDSDNVGGAWVN